MALAAALELLHTQNAFSESLHFKANSSVVSALL